MPTTTSVFVVTILLLKAVTAQTDQPSVVVDTCLLPPETGPCRGYFSRVFYNSTSETCQDFIYGGCHGNNNRFETKRECENACNRTSTPQPRVDICLLQPETGRCEGYFPKFHYNVSTDQCEEFIYGGCDGNDNRFETKLECENACNGTSTPQPRVDSCLLQPDTGPCYALFHKFYYNVTTENCEEFIYGGCEGNNNRFETQRECENACNDTSTPQPPVDICLLQPETGPCRAGFHRFFYNLTTEMCQDFIYGGCKGNDNRFKTRQECEVRCKNASANICLLPKETGPCEALIRKFYYNAATEKCEEFIYGGCEGNDNRFGTKRECENACNGTSTPQPRVDVCLLRPETGPCRGKFPKFFYNPNSAKCEYFFYGGCQGNNNRFETKQECEKTCNGTAIPKPTKSNCLLKPATGPCKGSFPRFFYNSTSRTCERFIYGGCQGNDNRFLTKDDCYLNCQYPLSDDVCHLAPDMGPCDANIQKYFYNQTAHACQLFTYGGCGGNNNRFDSKKACQQKCKYSTL